MFGNKLKTWFDAIDLLADMPTCSITLRTNKSGGYKCTYNVKSYDITATIGEYIADGIKFSEITANESAPDDHLIFQGELQRTSEGLYLLYSTIKDKMRVALSKDPHHLYGLRVLNMLKANMTAASYDDIIELLNEYPDHIIEFSTYDIELGNCRGRNTIVWEVRGY